MSKIYITANWKMHPQKFLEVEKLSSAIKEIRIKNKEKEIIICPPAIWLISLAKEFRGKNNLSLGAQNCHWKQEGAFTGEISAPMLADCGVGYVILGHSERRQYLGETNEIINLKIKAALKAKLRPILCVGEKEGQEMNLAVEEQLSNNLVGLGVNQAKEIIIAYEPVWAIGSDRPCLPDNALSATLFIRRIFTKLYSRFLAENTPILYGGSVDSQNAADYIKIARMDGLLIGGASLDAGEFLKIVNGI